jgi:hypothetical protein
VHLTDERVASAELQYLADALVAPCQVGSFSLTGHLARSATAMLFTARGPTFGDGEGVLKITGSVYAPILARELALLREAAGASIDGIVRPLSDELVWLAVGGDRADRPAAALALPFLAGGDLAALAVRAGRSSALGPALALEIARPVGEALRGLLTELDRPVTHGDVRPQNVLVPTPSSPASDLLLIDLDAAHELEPGALTSTARLPALAADVRGFGEILCLLANGTPSLPATGNRPFDTLAANCLSDGHYASIADTALWHDLASAEREQARRTAGAAGWLDAVRRVIRR